MANDGKMKNIILGAAVILVMAGIILVGMAVVRGFDEPTRSLETGYNQTITFGAVNVSTVQSDYDYIAALPACTSPNDTTTILTNTANYTWTKGNQDGGYVTLLDAGSEMAGNSVNCSVTYRPAVTATTYLELFITGLAIFASFIGIVVLSLLGKEVIRLFSKK